MNHDASQQTFYQRWQGLPDPEHAPETWAITVHEGFWAHDDYRHLNDLREPWESLLGSELCAAGRTLAAATGNVSNKHQILRDLAGALRRQVQRCLRRPLALVFDLYKAKSATRPRQRSLERWLLVLPVGALFRVKKSRSDARVGFGESCYFPLPIPSRPPEGWWLDLVEQLVLSFAKNKDGELAVRSEIETLAPKRGRPGIRDGEQAANIRFVSPASWGFGENSNPRPWRKDTVPPWDESASTAVVPRSAPLTRLAPLPPPEEEES